MARLGEHIPRMLLERGVEIAFGAPDLVSLEMYRGMAASPLRHVTPRCDRAAGFMADGHARATGATAACLVSGGPGMANLSAALRQAMNCSVPMLVLCATDRDGRTGMADPALAGLDDPAHPGLSSFCRWSQVIDDPDALPAALDAALAQNRRARPGPVVLDVPAALLARDVGLFEAPPQPPTPRESPDVAVCAEIVMRLDCARRPLLVLGGGAAGLGAAMTAALAERLGAPVMLTSNARGLLPPGHPLLFNGCLDSAPARRIVAGSDAALAFGVGFSAREWGPAPPFADGALLRVDIDAAQLDAIVTPGVALLADAGEAAERLLASIAERDDPPPAVAGDRAEAESALPHQLARYRPLMTALWDLAPNATVIGDVCEPARYGMRAAAPPLPRRWWTAESGFGAPGYALPAAIGAKLADQHRPVIALIGDGGVMHTLSELSTAVDARAPVVVIVWNNSGRAAVRDAMLAAKIRPDAVEPVAVDFHALARGFGAAYHRVSAPEFLRDSLRSATARTIPTVLELREEFWFAA